MKQLSPSEKMLQEINEKPIRRMIDAMDDNVDGMTHQQILDKLKSIGAIEIESFGALQIDALIKKATVIVSLTTKLELIEKAEKELSEQFGFDADTAQRVLAAICAGKIHGVKMDY